MLNIKNLSKRYEDGKLALNNLSLDLEKGEMYILLGANGAGKSTAINVLCGFISPTSGEFFIDGIHGLKEPLPARKKIAYLSENVMLYDNFTGYQNLAFFARLAGKKKTKSELESLLRDIGLQDDFIHKHTSTYSKGMRQKTGIAIAIIKDADLIIMDEPFSGLDPKAAYDFQNLLLELKQKGKAILMSTHDIFRAREMADKVGIMKDGLLVMTKTAKELEYEDLQKIYLDYMEGNIS
jgi:ABC-2 type transport system ATP-binding protein